MSIVTTPALLAASRNLNASSAPRLKFAMATVLLFVAGLGSVASAQSATSLSQVKKIYVEPFTGKRGAQDIQQEILHRLKHESGLKIVVSAAESDAVLNGTGEIWTKGYIANNPRATAADRRPVYGGYLLLSLRGTDSHILWTYLVTPGKFGSGAITSDLASQAATLVTTALVKSRTAAVPANSSSASPEMTVTLRGAGATFPAPLYQAWIQSFEQLHPGIRVTYDAVGSEEGIQRLDNREIDFAASDVPASGEKSVSGNGMFSRYATALGAVVPIYNLASLDRQLRFTPEVLAGIYLGQIARWNDAKIQAANKGVKLPDAPIAVVHRSDGSGTTYAFTDFLSRTSAVWKTALGAGSTIAWPIGRGEIRNDGVAAQVAQTPNSIGYVELTYAIQNDLNYGSVENAAGEFVSASLESVGEAAESAQVVGGSVGSIANAPGKYSYPIASFTWIVVPAEHQPAIDAMLRWMLSSGRKQSASLGYAPLPHEVAKRELETVSFPAK
jgi:phosphate ABC transporter phosphate-binding protein